MSSPPPPKLVTWTRAPMRQPFDAADHNRLVAYQNGELAAPQTWVAEDGTPGMAWDPAAGVAITAPTAIDGPITVAPTPPAVPGGPTAPSSDGHLTAEGQVKGWVTFTGTTAAITAQYNVATVARTGTGVYVVTWTLAFAATTAPVLVSYLAGSPLVCRLTARTATTVTIACVTLAAVAADPTSVSVVAFGTLAPA